MRKTLFMVAFVASVTLITSTVLAGEFGATSPVNKEGQYSAALGYSYSGSKVKLKDRVVVNKGDQKFVQNQVYLEGGYGFVKNWEGYLRLGVADLKAKGFFVDAALPGGTEDFDEGFKAFGTLGFRGIFMENPSYSIGLFVQGTLFSEYEDTDAQLSQFKLKNFYEADIGVTIQGKVGPAVVYAGPFLYVFRGKVEDTDLTIPAVIGTTKIQEKNSLGAFAGARCPFGSGYYANLEAQYKSGGAVALSLGKTF